MAAMFLLPMHGNRAAHARGSVLGAAAAVGRTRVRVLVGRGALPWLHWRHLVSRVPALHASALAHSEDAQGGTARGRRGGGALARSVSQGLDAVAGRDAPR